MTTHNDHPDLFSIYERVCNRGAKSWTDAWHEATEGLSLADLFALKSTGDILRFSTRERVQEELRRMGLPRLGSGLIDPDLRTGEDWFLGSFRGKPHVHYGTGTDMRDWYCDEIELAEPLLIEHGPYTLVQFAPDSLAIFETARRIEPLPWGTP